MYLFLYEVVYVQLSEQSLSKPVDPGLNLVISNSYCAVVAWKVKNENDELEAGKGILLEQRFTVHGPVEN